MKLIIRQSLRDLPNGIAAIDMGTISWVNINNDGRIDQKLDKNVLERQYLDLIASLGRGCKDVYWWASALSEKNDSFSHFFERIYKLVALDGALSKQTCECVGIICQDLTLAQQIRFNYKKKFDINYPWRFCLYKFSNDIGCLVKGFIKHVFRVCLECLVLRLTRKTLSFRYEQITDEEYVVLRTWVDSRSYARGVYNDVYFGKLLPFIQSRSKRVLIFAGIVSGQRAIIKKIAKDKENLIIPVNFYLRIIDILHCFTAVYLHRVKLKGEIIMAGFNVGILAQDELMRDIFDTEFFTAILQYYCCKRLAERVRMGNFIYTFENYAWEKTTIMGLRAVAQNIKITGFQHAFVARNTFKYFPGHGEAEFLPLPQRLVTMGKRTAFILNNFGNYPPGIFKLGCALRHEYLFRLPVLSRNVDGPLFVPLTITVQDTIKVIKFLIAAKLDKSNKIYLRFHPATPQSEVFNRLDVNLPDNFIISCNKSIYEELERCSIVLYTWTTVCLEALKMGRPVIYLDVNYPINVDPLFECKYLGGICCQPEELSASIAKLRGMNNEIFVQELKNAQKYLDDYFYPVSEESLAEFN